MLLQSLLIELERIAPLGLAEPWDNVGLLIGDPRQEVGRVLLTIDYTRAVAAEANALHCNLVIAYHPPLFAAIKQLTAEGLTELLHDAIRKGIAIYSPHTAWDAAPGGTNDFLADCIGLTDITALRPSGTSAAGHGRIGNLPEAISAGALIDRVKKKLNLNYVLFAGDAEKPIRRIAICAGAGGELLDHAIAGNAEVYLTGELRHHDVLKADRAGLCAICTLHSNSERPSLTRLKARLEKLQGDRPVVFLSQSDRDPFSIR